MFLILFVVKSTVVLAAPAKTFIVLIVFRITIVNALPLTLMPVRVVIDFVKIMECFMVRKDIPDLPLKIQNLAQVVDVRLGKLNFFFRLIYFDRVRAILSCDSCGKSCCIKFGGRCLDYCGDCEDDHEY